MFSSYARYNISIGNAHSSPGIKADEQEMPKRINGTRSRVFAKVSHIRRET